MKKTMNVSMELFYIMLVKCGFKKCAVTTQNTNVYVNEDAEFLVVKSIYMAGATQMVEYYMTNTKYNRSTAKNNAGYYVVKFDKVYTIHSLVAKAFLGDRPDGYEIDHVSGDKSDNTMRNLEYVTHKENMRRHYAKCPHTTHIYRGRYMASTETYTDENGQKIKMSKQDYVNMLATTRGKTAALRAAKRLGLN